VLTGFYKIHCISDLENVGLARVKIKVKLSLYLTEHHAMKAYGGVEV
jgi:hypothetical protein